MAVKKFFLGGIVVAWAATVFGGIGVSQVSPRYFADEQGRAWIPIGCNICFDRLAKNSTEARKLFDAWMTAFAANGGNHMRLWLSQPFVEVMPEKAGEFSREATENLKWLVSRAEALNIKLKFTFENFRRPGARTDVSPAAVGVSFRDPVYAPYARNIHEVFTKKDCYDIYLSKARHVAEAVGKSDALIAVELWNEINSTGCDLTALGDWSTRMLADLKRLFRGKMTLQNLGSFSEPTDFLVYDWMARQKGNDYMQAHRYLDPGAVLDVCKGPMDVLCADAVRELLDRRPDMPAILAETGAVKARHTGPSHFYDLDAMGLLLHDELFAPFFAGSAGCGQPWHWDHTYIHRHNLWHHFRRFKTAVDGLDPVAEDFRPFHTETTQLRIWGLRGKKTTVLWLRDKRATREALLERKKKAPLVSNVRIPFNASSYHWYLPWEDKTATTTSAIVPDFTISAVVRFPTK